MSGQVASPVETDTSTTVGDGVWLTAAAAEVKVPRVAVRLPELVVKKNIHLQLHFSNSLSESSMRIFHSDRSSRT